MANAGVDGVVPVEGVNVTVALLLLSENSVAAAIWGWFEGGEVVWLVVLCVSCKFLQRNKGARQKWADAEDAKT